MAKVRVGVRQKRRGNSQTWGHLLNSRVRGSVSVSVRVSVRVRVRVTVK
jgi:hypothetical protein